MGWVINVENINVEIQTGDLCRHFWAGGINVDTKLETYVDRIEHGALMSKAKLETYVDRIEHGGINVDTVVINVEFSHLLIYIG